MTDNSGREHRRGKSECQMVRGEITVIQGDVEYSVSSRMESAGFN